MSERYAQGDPRDGIRATAFPRCIRHVRRGRSQCGTMTGIGPPGEEPGQLAKEPLIHVGHRRGRALAAGAALALCLCAQAASGPAEAPKRAPGAKGATGSIVLHEEASGSRILYHEEAGGILLPVAPPLERDRRKALPGLKPAGRAEEAARAKSAPAAGTGARK